MNIKVAAFTDSEKSSNTDQVFCLPIYVYADGEFKWEYVHIREIFTKLAAF